MSARRFNVALDGADDKGRYRVVYKVLASDPDEATVLARASAALQDVAVFEIGGIVDLGESPFETGDARRVVGQSGKVYGAPNALEAGEPTGDGATLA